VVPEVTAPVIKGAILAGMGYLGHVLTGNEHGVIVGACVSEAGPEPSAR